MQQQYGMLGPMPWQVEQQQQLMGRQADMQAAQLTPEQAGVFNSAQGGRALGGALNQIGGAFGLPVGKNEAVAQAQKMQAIQKEIMASGIKPTDTEAYLSNLGEKLAAAGMIDESLNVSKALQAHRDKQMDLDIKKDTVEVARARAEAYRLNKITPANEAIWKNIKEYDPGAFAKWSKSITPDNAMGDLDLLKFKDDANKDWKVEGTAPDGQVVWSNKEGRLGKTNPDGKMEPYGGTFKSKSGTNVTVEGSTFKVENIDKRPGEDVVGAVNAGVQAAVQKPELESITQNARLARTQLPDIAKMRELASSGNLLTGSLADQQLGLARIAATMGNATLAKKVNDSDFFDQFVMELVLPKMKMLGGSDSNEELKKLQQATVSRTLTPTQILRSLEFMENKIVESQRVYNEYNTGREAGRTDYLNFDTVNGRWLTPVMRESNQVGTREVKVEEKNAGGRPSVPPARQPQPAAYVSPPAPVRAAPVIPRGNPAFESAVSKVMEQFGISREMAEARLMAEKAKKGQK